MSLRRRGVRKIVVIDRGAICGEATGASAGGLWPAHECLTLASAEIARRAWDTQLGLLEQFPCDFVPSGLLSLVDEAGTDRPAGRVAETRAAGFEARLLQPAELRDVEPALGHPGPAIHYPSDGSIHPLKLAAGIVSWLRRKGVAICTGQRVTAVDAAGSLTLGAAGQVQAGAAVISAGAWTPLLTAVLDWEPPIRPIRGVLLASETQANRTLRTVVVAKPYYYWQLGCGPVAGGGSEEDVGFQSGVSERVAQDIRRDWARLFPSLAGTAFPCSWFGFRPYCSDMQPVIGRVPGTRSVYASAGHFRKGILLSPLSGELLADEIVDGRPPALAEAFRPDRFARIDRTG